MTRYDVISLLYGIEIEVTLQEPSQQRALASVNPVSTPPATQELANDDEPSNEAP